eukprot:TRINITY_DN157848_c0_g1_i1.p1 TRINITY_DN157848_c0_g1~~TRINITY_DN157848_c0_g1_i1.p1  ORF type:complete len:201 (-),score=25.45 TRINITY_DN157848_c0_g1_i1:8-610(-)
MKDEVSCATEFMVAFVQKAKGVPIVAVQKFQKCLAEHMTNKYRHHWHPQKPQRGSAYRSITIDHKAIDPLIIATLKDISLDRVLTENIIDKLPRELTLWVDPMDVSYRFGDHGSVGVLHKQAPAKQTIPDYASGVSSANSSASSSPCSRPTPPQSPYDYLQQQQPMAHSIYRQCGREVMFPSPFQNQNRYYYNRMETQVA